MDYSVVIPTLGERDSLVRCLASIAAQSRPPREVILAAADGAMVDNVSAGTRVVRAAPSTSGQRNAGARVAVSPVVLFLDDDIVLEPDFGERMMEVWESRGLDRIAGVLGTNLGGDAFSGNQSVVHRALRAAGGLGHAALFSKGSRLMSSGHPSIVAHPTTAQDVRFAPGGCVSYRRDLLEREPFDETYSGYVFGEDLDLSARMSRIAPIVHTPDAKFTHEHGTPGLGGGAAAAERRAMWAFFRGRHRRPGPVGTLAWEWANGAELAILLARAAKTRDFQPPRAFLAGLRDARRRLASEAKRAPEPGAS